MDRRGVIRLAFVVRVYLFLEWHSVTVGLKPTVFAKAKK